MDIDFKNSAEFGGKLGEEFRQVWAAINRNKIIDSTGFRMSKTTKGTEMIINPDAFGNEDETNTGVGLVKNLVVTTVSHATQQGPVYGPYPSTPQLPVNLAVCFQIQVAQDVKYEFANPMFPNIGKRQITGDASHQFIPPPIPLTLCQDQGVPQASVFSISQPTIDFNDNTIPYRSPVSGYSQAQGKWYYPNLEYWESIGYSLVQGDFWRIENPYQVGEIIFAIRYESYYPNWLHYLNTPALAWTWGLTSGFSVVGNPDTTETYMELPQGESKWRWSFD